MGDRGLDETADETGTGTFLGKPVGQFGNFPYRIRNLLVAFHELPGLGNGGDFLPCAVGQLHVHQEFIKVEFVLLLEVIGLKVIFPVRAQAHAADRNRFFETKLPPRLLFLLLMQERCQLVVLQMQPGRH